MLSRAETPSSHANEKGGESLVATQMRTMYNLFDRQPMLVISRSGDSRVLVYDAVIDGPKNLLLRVDLYQVDLSLNGSMRRESVTGTALKLFRMSISCAKPTAKMPRYELSVPVMPDRLIEAVVSKGEVKAKSHIGVAKCQIHRVSVNMSWINLLGKRIPKIHHIDLYGLSNKQEPVKERLDSPSVVDYMKLLD